MSIYQRRRKEVRLSLGTEELEMNYYLIFHFRNEMKMAAQVRAAIRYDAWLSLELATASWCIIVVDQLPALFARCLFLFLLQHLL